MVGTSNTDDQPPLSHKETNYQDELMKVEELLSKVTCEFTMLSLEMTTRHNMAEHKEQETLLLDRMSRLEKSKSLLVKHIQDQNQPSTSMNKVETMTGPHIFSASDFPTYRIPGA